MAGYRQRGTSGSGSEPSGNIFTRFAQQAKDWVDQGEQVANEDRERRQQRIDTARAYELEQPAHKLLASRGAARMLYGDKVENGPSIFDFDDGGDDRLFDDEPRPDPDPYPNPRLTSRSIGKPALRISGVKTKT